MRSPRRERIVAADADLLRARLPAEKVVYLRYNLLG